MRPSMGSRGDAYDNAMAESFFGTLEAELLARRRFQSHEEARAAIFEYIETWYNPRRLHSSIGYAHTRRGRFSFAVDAVRRFMHRNPRLFPRSRRRGRS